METPLNEQLFIIDRILFHFILFYFIYLQKIEIYFSQTQSKNRKSRKGPKPLAFWRKTKNVTDNFRDDDDKNEK